MTFCDPMHASPTCEMEFDERALGMVLGLEWVALARFNWVEPIHEI